MSKLIFLYDKTMDKEYRKKLLLPIHFIAYGYIYAKMYYYYEHKRNEFIAIDNNHVKRKWGNNKVFGGIFLLDYFNVTIRELDSLYACSKSMLNENNKNDIMHREIVKANIIQFDSLYDLGVMKYHITGDTKVHAYLGNPNHQYIQHRIKMNRYRVVDGIDKKNFKLMFEQEGVI